MAKERHQNVPASYLTLLKDNKVLLLKRFNTGYENGNYSMVAGHVDPGESFVQCIIREAKEEAGIQLDPEDLKVAHVMHRNSKTQIAVMEKRKQRSWKAQIAQIAVMHSRSKSANSGYA